MHACIPKICSPKICIHACSLSMHIWGCATMFRWEKNDVPHIWGCPTMFFGFGAVQRCSDGKKMMFPTFGSVQRCSAEKKRCFLLLGLSNDVSMGKKRCSPHLGLSNDVSPKKNDVPHIWGCPTMFFAFGLSNDVSLKKSDGRSGGRSQSRTVAPAAAHKMDVQHIWAWQNQCLVRGGFPRGGNLGRGKSLKTNIPY